MPPTSTPDGPCLPLPPNRLRAVDAAIASAALFAASNMSTKCPALRERFRAFVGR
jgi:hypothetical protein